MEVRAVREGFGRFNGGSGGSSGSGGSMAVQGSMEVQGRFERFMGGSWAVQAVRAVRSKKIFFLTIFFSKKKKPNLNRPNRTEIGPKSPEIETGPESPGTGTAT